MPMFKALAACPDAVVIRPDMEKYRRVGHEVRALMNDITPLVEPISIDEAFLDLSGTQRLHHGAPAETLVKLAMRIERDIGINVSIGLSFNKFLAKMASDLDKPRGFAAIGEAEAVEFLSDLSVGKLWGVGRALRSKLERDGIDRIGQLKDWDEADLVARYGSIGRRLKRFANAQDMRIVDPESSTKSISAETTFEDDVADIAESCDSSDWGDDRYLVLSPAYIAALRKVGAIKDTSGYGYNAIQNGDIPMLHGFKVIMSNAIPANGENLTGFATDGNGIAAAFRYLAPQQGHKYNRAEALVGEGGITLGLRDWYSEDSGVRKNVIETVYAYETGIGTGVKRLVSA